MPRNPRADQIGTGGRIKSESPGGCARNAQSLGEPDPFRLKYRTELRKTVAAIIRAKIGRKQVASEIAKLFGKQIEPNDRDAFAIIVEEELINLHEGNFARYQVRPSEFAAWQNVWATK